MDWTSRLGTKSAWVVLVLVALAGVVTALGLEPSAEAQRGGHLPVARLELSYSLEEGALNARFHLASGLAVDQRIDDDRQIDHLLQAAEIHAAGKARMSVTITADRLSAWHLAVP